MNQTDARAVAAAYLKESLDSEELECVIIDEFTLESANYFVFCYNSREYLETGKFGSQLAGNCPLLVTKVDGRIFLLPTFQSVQKSLAQIGDKDPSEVDFVGSSLP